MAIVRPFKALRPPKELAAQVASLPYDVMDSNEAREMAKGKEKCFLHVVKPEIDLDPSIDLYDKRVYAKAAENFKMFQDKGWLKRDTETSLYVYRQIMDGRSQTGLMCCCSADEYWAGKIKKHEFTRHDKEEDRLAHIRATNANTGPAFLTYRARPEIDALMEEAMKSEPVADFVAEDGIQHTGWKVSDKKWIDAIVKEFAKIEALYIADGHHRSQSACRYAKEKAEANPNHTGNEEYNFFMAVVFPQEQLFIYDYNRAVKDLNGHSEEEFLKLIGQKFNIEKNPQKKPSKARTFGMYMDKTWYMLTAKPGTFDDKDAVASLDVSILQKNLLEPILGIKNPREDKKIDFIGGIRGIKELERIVDSKKFKVAFSMYPTNIEQLLAVADSGQVMPPKSTWFEPKLRSGLFIHTL